MKISANQILKIFLFCTTMVGIYYSVYSHAYNEYAKEVSSLEKEIELAATQLDKENNYHFAFDKLPYLQNILISVEPYFFSPNSIYLSLLGDKILSGEHMYKISEIIQQNRYKLNNLMLQGLVLNKQVKITSDGISSNHYNSNYPMPLYYLDFTNSNFSKTHLKNSLFHTLNLENSNFENSEYDNAIIKNSKLATSNFSKTRINQTSFINTQITGVKFDNSTIIYSDFVSCALYGSSFDNATIINSSFVKTNVDSLPPEGGSSNLRLEAD